MERCLSVPLSVAVIVGMGLASIRLRERGHAKESYCGHQMGLASSLLVLSLTLFK